MTATAARPRFLTSIKGLMIAIAVIGLFLTLAVLTRRQVNLERMKVNLALDRARVAIYANQIQAAPAATQAATGSRSAGPTDLWAAVAVSHSLFQQGQTKDLTFEFTLVNDGKQPIDPAIAESKLVIDGDELDESGSILTTALAGVSLKALPPGSHLQFQVALGKRNHFRQPGTYRLCWKGQGFESPEVVVRILPAESD